MEVRLSKNEKRLYGFIIRHREVLRGGRITTDELTIKFYNNTIPPNGRVYVANMLRSIKRKSMVVPGMRQVESTEGSGRRAIEVWLAPTQERVA
jgi:hypothetical protein